MRILHVGDVIGQPGRRALAHALPRIKAEHGTDFVIVNAENAAGGFGLTPEIAQDLFTLGADVLTSGNHIWDKKQVLDYLDREPRVLRPDNYPEGVPGRGWGVYEPVVGGPKVAVLNLEGRVYMHNLRDPFTVGRERVTQLRRETPIVIVDFHAEITSEKRALGWHLDGLASAVIGTHTHVQTADEEVLPGGTAYLTDAGMTGGRDSVIGIEVQEALQRFLTQMPARFSPAPGRLWLNGAVVDVDEATGRARSIQRVQMAVKE
jgi:2',3'-cyclic-nucleotide 2'-phosphodiesterase